MNRYFNNNNNNNDNNLIHIMHSVRKSQTRGTESRGGKRSVVSLSGWLSEWHLGRRLKVATVAEALVMAGISFHMLGEQYLKECRPNSIFVYDI